MDRLSQLVKRLLDAKVEFVLVGGMAVMSYGIPLVTQDVDICCRFTEDNLMRIQAAVADLNPRHRNRPDMPLALSSDLCARLKNLYIQTSLGFLDCLGSVLGVGDFQEVLNRSIEVEIPAGRVRLISLDALLDAKSALSRPHDLAAVRHIKLLQPHLLRES
jgi:predicted nucleotidyltransferase